MNKNSVHDGAALLNGDRVSSTLAAIPYARHLGVRVAEFSEAGAVVFHLPFEERLVGNVTLPALHGGVIAAFMLGGTGLNLFVFARGATAQAGGFLARLSELSRSNGSVRRM
jgi:uncharacterized membrane protein